MAEVLNERQLEQVLNNYLDRLEGKVNIDQAVLYGSYANGKASEYSDIDLLVISKDLPEDRTKGTNGLYLDRIVKDFDLRLEVIGIHPNKLNNPITKSFFKEIIKTGKTIRVNGNSKKL